MKQKHILWLAACMAAMPTTGIAQTQDLGQLDVTSSRIESPSIQSSKPVTIISREEIEASHAVNVADLFKGQAGITVRDTSGVGAKAVIDLGGFGDSAASNKVVLIDGRRISNPDLAEADWTQIPIDQIERIEILHGAGSVLYGDGAVGGVINIITRIPESGGQIALGGGSFGSQNGKARIGADTGKVRLEANFSGQKTDGYRDNSKYERYDAGARFEADISDNIMWYGSGNHHTDRFGLPGALTQAQIDTNPKQTLKPDDYGSTTDDFINSGLLINAGPVELDLPASFRRRDSSAHFGGLFPFDSTSVLRTVSIRPKMTVSHEHADFNSQLIAGADIDKVKGTVAGLDAKRDRSGYYAQFTVSDSDSNYVVSGGFRSEKVNDALIDGTSTASNRLNAYDIGTSIGFGDFRLRLNHNRSIRLPRLDERTEYLFPTFAPNFRADLLPQTGMHYNAALRYEAESAWLEVSYQHAKLKHEIYLDPTIGFFGTNSNYVDPTLHRVLTIAGFWHAHDFAQISANFTQVRATFQGGAFSGNHIPGVPQSRFGLNLKSDWSEAFSTTLHSTYVGASHLINDQLNSRPKLAAYFLVDAAASYRWQGVEVFVRVDNLTNKKYISTGAVSPSAGTFGLYPAATISIHGGVSYNF
ncbi:vitamin B12 transporter [Mariprofundus micogutta]|uniref:Vitamin B12 transporter n=1 Tax=Mariprofundus micogutta TaxID=1921010 RepID=A0A1L8CL50_9PROT|nr:TonB-dependent receptor [Mariprofundus micogutta]GAV19615.1 vitamin B12 transporter [Mariprofundus micogutta]